MPSQPDTDHEPDKTLGSKALSRWFFEKRGRLGGASGETVLNTVAASCLDIEDLLVREAIQNSCDAAVPVSSGGGEREEVKVVFRKKILREEGLDRLVDELGLDELQRRSWDINGSLSDAYDRMLDDLREIPILFIEDYGTSGLGGRLDRPDHDSDFAKFVYDFGFQGKAYGKSTGGGSYGLGKGAHSRASELRCFFIHTVIQPFERQCELPLDGQIGENQWARFQGVCHFPLHEADGCIWTGRGFFGNRMIDRADPLANEDAQSMAERLSFPARCIEDRGTTIAILGCNASLDQLCRAVEDWWWPRLFQHTLEVEFIDEDLGDEYKIHPRPLRRPELIPFIRCFDSATGDFFRNSKDLSSPSLKPVLLEDPNNQTGKKGNPSSVPAGNMVMTHLPSNIRDDSDSTSPLIDSIALIRGSRMVVSYRKIGARGLPVAATYVASEALDHTLMLSEPVTHHDWDPTSARLSEVEQSSVASLLRRLERHVRRYQTSSLPSYGFSNDRALALERSLGFVLGGGGLLADCFLSQSKPTRKPVKMQSIQIRLQSDCPHYLPDGLIVTDGKLYIDWMGTVGGLKKIRLTLRAASIGNDRLVRMDSIAVAVRTGKIVYSSDSTKATTIDITLKAGQTESIPVRIGPHPEGVRLRLFSEGEEISE